LSEAKGPPPRDLACYLEPFGVLVEHRIHDVDERLVTREETVAAREEISLQPPLAQVFAQHLHHPAIGRNMVVGLEDLGCRDTLRDVKEVCEAIGCRLIRTNNPKVAVLPVQLHHVADERPHDPG